jgi:hypothetical protein
MFDSESEFSGDLTGSIFNAPDVVLQSPPTNERILDTQSGFIVVLKNIDGRLALSVKRRIGTPPTSSIFFTPDESLQLSKILVSSNGDSINGFEDSPESNGKNAIETNGASGHYYLTVTNKPAKYSALDGILNGARKHILGLSLLLLLSGCVSGYFVGLHQQLKLKKSVVTTLYTPTDTRRPDPLSAAELGKFASYFVTNMLDFNPTTYRVSQTRAMSCMAPDVVNTYWKETSFPLNQKDLAALPQDNIITIAEVQSKRLAPSTAKVTVKAKLANRSSKTSNIVQLDLIISPDATGQLRITKLQDTTSS